MKNSLIILMISLIAVTTGCKKEKPHAIPGAGPRPPFIPPAEKRWVVTTIAGDGSAGFANGIASIAKFHFPVDVAIDDEGALYVTDAFNHAIRMIGGEQVATYTGGNGFGILNGDRTIAKFEHPNSIAIDLNGNLYTTDDNDPQIRITRFFGNVATYAGTDMAGFADGNADIARFGWANSITTDLHGNLYVSDAVNNRIRKVTTDDKVITIAGNGNAGFKNGNGTEAEFFYPAGIAIDRQGNLYVADRLNLCIRKITPAGDVSVFSGSGISGDRDGSAEEAQFTEDMHDLVVDGQGNLYLSGAERIRKISPLGVVSTIAGSIAGFNDGDGLSAKFNYPNGMAIDGAGTIYIADLKNNRIRKLSFE